MADNAMTTEESLEKLEKKLVTIRWTLLALAVVLALIGAYFASVHAAASQRKGNGEIRAGSFVVVDDQGRIRAKLTADKDAPLLSILDENGKTRAALTVLKSGPPVVQVGKAWFPAPLFPDGPALVMYDENGETRTTLGAFKEGSGLFMCDEHNKLRVRLVVPTKGPSLRMRDETGKTASAALGVTKVEPGLYLYDETGKTTRKTLANP